MMRHVPPALGGWYRDLRSGSVFEIVAWDMHQQTIETQLIDGELSECDVDAWNSLMLERIEEPEDWRNAYELDREDARDPDETYHPEDWSNPISSIEPQFEVGLDDS